eukprot:6209354-Pleurochrysis_carterae.AAC.1
MSNDRTRGPSIPEGMPPPILRIRAAFWLSGQLAKGRSATLAGATIHDVRMAKLFGSAAYAILNELASRKEHAISK